MFHLCELISCNVTPFSINGTFRLIFPHQEAYDLIFETFLREKPTSGTKSQELDKISKIQEKLSSIRDSSGVAW